jgi:archaemetzincin
MRVLLIFLFAASLLNSCSNEPAVKIDKIKQIITGKKIKILIQPFSDLPEARAKYVFTEVTKKWPDTRLLPAIELPSIAYYKPRNRYRADILINWLKQRIVRRQFIAGITSKDVSTTKPDNPDYGIMGLGYLKGPSCIISTFRLKKGSDEQLLKTVMHELGHNFGLKHCPALTCLMRDAKGKNHLDELTGFCISCKSVMMKAGWKL